MITLLTVASNPNNQNKVVVYLEAGQVRYLPQKEFDELYIDSRTFPRLEQVLEKYGDTLIPANELPPINKYTKAYNAIVQGIKEANAKQEEDLSWYFGEYSESERMTKKEIQKLEGKGYTVSVNEDTQYYYIHWRTRSIDD